MKIIERVIMSDKIPDFIKWWIITMAFFIPVFFVALLIVKVFAL